MSILKRLDELVPGQGGRIASISPCGNLRRRLMEMGLVIGSELMVIRVAPAGDPVEVLLRGYSLALRKNEAKQLILEVDAA
ncbi:MAG: ferrous iron transport protein A [Methanothrix sp.]|nr:ferrous iron transport protein A [Methanothrix sp.]OPY45963.1 MAG: ferrous iron transport protein A [Methanosaeta sp. PtaU1.Bin016]HOV52120.1 ferrous iron transport protein A [Methanothrix sp.]